MKHFLIYFFVNTFRYMYRLRGFKIIYLLYYTIWLVYSILYVLCVLTLKTLGNDSLIF